MRVTNFFILAAPALVAAQNQIPLADKAKGWFDQASAFAKSLATNPGRIAAAKVAQATVTSLTYSNWKSTLQHSGQSKPNSPPEAWMVYVTGQNKTCHGKCWHVDNVWNEAVTQLATDPNAPKLASIDCDSQILLCGAWGCNVASIWYFLVPQPGPKQSPASTDITIHRLNLSSATASDITNIYKNKLYLSTPNYEGVLHPMDGLIARYKLTDPMAYTLFYLGKVPSWAFMIFLSLFSRYFVNKRMPPAGPPTAAGGAAPVPAPAAG